MNVGRILEYPVAEPQTNSHYNIWLTLIRILIGVALLVYLSFSGSITWSALAGLAKSWELSVAALFLLLIMVALTSWRLCLLLKPRGLVLSLGSSIQLTLIGAYFSVFLPGGVGGDLVRVYYAMRGNYGHRTEIATVILFDRLIGIFALLIFPLLLVPLFPQLLNSAKFLLVLLGCSVAGSVTMLAALIICFTVPATDGSVLLRIFQKLPLGNYPKRIFNTVHDYRQNVGTLAGAVAISILVQLIVVSVMLLLVQSTSAQGTNLSMAVLIPFGLMANSLPLTPGGLGVGELAFGKLFALGGFTGGIEALLGWRALTTVIDLMGLAIYLHGRQEILSYRPAPAVPNAAE